MIMQIVLEAICLAVVVAAGVLTIRLFRVPVGRPWAELAGITYGLMLFAVVLVTLIGATSGMPTGQRSMGLHTRSQAPHGITGPSAAP